MHPVQKHSITRKKVWLNKRARPATRQELFSALEMFINTGDSASDLRRFCSQHRKFFPVQLYHQSIRLAAAGKDNFFNWYKRQLRKVWRRNDPADIRLGVLLGLRQPYYAGLPEGEFESDAADHMKILGDAVELYGENATVPGSLGAHLFPAAVSPQWGVGGFDYRSTTDFQRAVYELMRDSWRARLCLKCDRYMIAEKAHNYYCSVGCSGAVKKKRDREYWKTKGDLARKRRRRKDRQN